MCSGDVLDPAAERISALTAHLQSMIAQEGILHRRIALLQKTQVEEGSAGPPLVSSVDASTEAVAQLEASNKVLEVCSDALLCGVCFRLLGLRCRVDG